MPAMPSAHDAERVSRNARALDAADLDGLVCALPMHVLLATGYWPVVGASIAIVTRDGQARVIVPEDELELATRGWAVCQGYQPGGLDALRSAYTALQQPFADALRQLGLTHGRIGYEHGPFSEPASYAAMTVWGASVAPLLAAAAPRATPVDANATLAGLRAIKTPTEIERMRAACRVAGSAFGVGAGSLRVGQPEHAVAGAVRQQLAVGVDDSERADGFVYCMSGPHAAAAGGAYARSRARRVGRGETILVHCNSYVGGYWTDITRTYCLGAPDARLRGWFEAVLAARAAALAIVRPGARAADVDRAARDVLTARGGEATFPHGAGHGVGFEAIVQTAQPRQHPRSDDVLAPGMVCNVEPALYLDGVGGLRHCDMLAVTETGYELLTPFQAELDDLIRAAP
jgi:Xaa-Pro dipeptidase